jgi:hypothetical protein
MEKVGILCKRQIGFYKIRLGSRWPNANRPNAKCNPMPNATQCRMRAVGTSVIKDVQHSAVFGIGSFGNGSLGIGLFGIGSFGIGSYSALGRLALCRLALCCLAFSHDTDGMCK